MISFPKARILAVAVAVVALSARSAAEEEPELLTYMPIAMDSNTTVKLKSLLTRFVAVPNADNSETFVFPKLVFHPIP
jgi:hypothetical protein